MIAATVLGIFFVPLLFVVVVKGAWARENQMAAKG